MYKSFTNVSADNFVFVKTYSPLSFFENQINLNLTISSVISRYRKGFCSLKFYGAEVALLSSVTGWLQLLSWLCYCVFHFLGDYHLRWTNRGSWRMKNSFVASVINMPTMFSSQQPWVYKPWSLARTPSHTDKAGPCLYSRWLVYTLYGVFVVGVSAHWCG